MAAATDDPASLGTEMLQFSASAKSNPLAGRKQNPENLFTATEETLIEWEEVRGEKPPSLPASPRCLPKEQTDDARFSDVHRAVELVATEQQSLSERTDQSLSAQCKRIAELETALQEQQTAFSALELRLSRKTAAKIIASVRQVVKHLQAP